MLKLFCLGALVFGHGIEADLSDDGAAASLPRDPVEYDVHQYKSTAPRCSPDELCDDSADLSNWQRLQRADRYDGAWNVTEHPWLAGKRQLVMEDALKYHGLTRPVTAWSPDRPLAFSMTARFGEDHNCGGAYVKLYSGGADFDGETPYSIMFGPDRCGGATRKVHWIAQYTDASGKRVEEHLATTLDLPADLRKTHSYGFSLQPDGKLEIYLDNEIAREGNLKTLTTPGWKSPETIDDPTDPTPEDWAPPARMIPDSSATKPEDWDDDEPETIEDRDASRPDDWLEDEPELVPNPDATKPEDWNDAEDGEWTRPMMKNPKCAAVSGCGIWTRPMIPNPKYKGPWSPPMIPNPEYTEKYPTRQIPHPYPYDIAEPFKTIEPFNALGVEIWTVQAGTVMDNFILTTRPDHMKAWARATFAPIAKAEQENHQKELAQDFSNKKAADAKDNQWYVKIGAIAMLAIIILAVGIRKLFGSHFRTTDMPPTVASKKTDEPSAEKASTENATTDNAKENDASASAEADRKLGEQETEAPAGETKPVKRS